MREAGILYTMERLRSFRVEGDRVITFPVGPIWHSITLEPAENYTPHYVPGERGAMG